MIEVDISMKFQRIENNISKENEEENSPKILLPVLMKTNERLIYVGEAYDDLTLKHIIDNLKNIYRIKNFFKATIPLSENKIKNLDSIFTRTGKLPLKNGEENYSLTCYILEAEK